MSLKYEPASEPQAADLLGFADADSLHLEDLSLLSATISADAPFSLPPEEAIQETRGPILRMEERRSAWASMTFYIGSSLLLTLHPEPCDILGLRYKSVNFRAGRGARF